jgi:hypothetical protein
MSLRKLLDDQIKKIETDNPDIASEKDKDKKFELVVANIVNLKYLNALDYDDLKDGIVGKSGDEGIDLYYLFNNNKLITDTFGRTIESTSLLSIDIFQIKNQDSFSTDGFRIMTEGIKEIFNLDLNESQLKKLGMNELVLNKVLLTREVFRKAKTIGATIKLNIYYVTASSTKEISTKITHLKDDLLKTVGEHYNIIMVADFLNAQDLLNLIKRKDEQLIITFENQPLRISVKDSTATGYTGFIKTVELVKSLIDINGRFRDELTEGNIRFFLGEDKLINTAIIETAKSLEKQKIFWAMNNGVTIIGDTIEPAGGNEFIINNPQIVNGCQTIHCLYTAYVSDGNTMPDSIKILVKLIQTKDAAICSDIISATNSQNAVKSSAIKANDAVQRNIEMHLLQSGIYYERRQNFYKRQHITGQKVISLQRMAQIMHSVCNKKSIEAINETKKIFEEDSIYKSIFSIQSDYDVYTFACMLYLKIWSMKNSDCRKNKYSSEIKDLISKSGFSLISITSALILKSLYKKDEKIEIPKDFKININTPSRKNYFVSKKIEAIAIINNDTEFEKIYIAGKKIFLKAADKYSQKNNKAKVTLFKNRSFDKDFIIPELFNYFKKCTI